MHTEEKKKFLEKAYPFNLLTEQEKDLLIHNSSLSTFNGREVLFKQGEFTHKALYLIISGKVEIEVSDSQGLARVVNYRYPYDFFGETGIFTQDEYPASAKAVQETICLTLPEEELHNILSQNHRFSAQMTRILVDRMRTLYSKYMFEDDQRTEEPLLRSRVTEIMTAPPSTCSLDDSIIQVAKIIISRNISSVVVTKRGVEGEIPVGIITERDLVYILGHELWGESIGSLKRSPSRLIIETNCGKLERHMKT